MCQHQSIFTRFIKLIFLILIALGIGTLTPLSGRFKTQTSEPIPNNQQSKKVTARLRFTLPGGKKKMPVHLIAFSPDGRFVANSRGGEEVKIWDVATGKLQATLTGDKRGTDGFSFSPDGRTAATRDLFDKKVSLWNVETGKLIATLSGLKSRMDKMKAVKIQLDAFAHITFSPNGEMILTERNDDTVDVWDVATGKLRATLEHDKNREGVDALVEDYFATRTGAPPQQQRPRLPLLAVTEMRELIRLEVKKEMAEASYIWIGKDDQAELLELEEIIRRAERGAKAKHIYRVAQEMELRYQLVPRKRIEKAKRVVAAEAERAAARSSSSRRPRPVPVEPPAPLTPVAAVSAATPVTRRTRKAVGS